jgi:hypothetical protein
VAPGPEKALFYRISRLESWAVPPFAEVSWKLRQREPRHDLHELECYLGSAVIERHGLPRPGLCESDKAGRH